MWRHCRQGPIISAFQLWRPALLKRASNQFPSVYWETFVTSSILYEMKIVNLLLYDSLSKIISLETSDKYLWVKLDTDLLTLLHEYNCSIYKLETTSEAWFSNLVYSHQTSIAMTLSDLTGYVVYRWHAVVKRLG